jgi:tetratricopeptide (TPR) repeat protein
MPALFSPYGAAAHAVLLLMLWLLPASAQNTNNGASTILISVAQLAPTGDEKSYLQQGKTLEDKRDYPAAIVEYDKAIEINPKDAAVYESRASAKGKSGDAAGAIVDFNKAIEINPQDAEAYKGAEQRITINDLAGANSDYGKAIEINPNDANAYKGRGWLKSTWERDPTGAVPDFTQAIALNPNDAEAYSGRAAAKLDLGNLDGGIADYSESIRLNPNDATSFSSRGKAELAELKFAEAVSDYNQAIGLSQTPNNEMVFGLSDNYIGRGRVKFAQGDYDGAIADFNLSLGCKFQLFPGDAIHERGLVKAVKGDIDGALADYDSAIQLSSKTPSTILFEAQADRGYARLLKGDLDGAISDESDAVAYYARVSAPLRTMYLEDVEQTTYCAGTYHCRGLARKGKKDLAGAIADFSKAIELRPTYANAYINRGIIENGQGSFDPAIADFSKAIEINPNDAKAYANRGYANFGKKNFNPAFADFKKAADLGSAWGQRMLGVFYARGVGVTQNYGEAARCYQRAAYQGDADAQYQLGLLYYNGAGVAKDDLEALAWANIAASTGIADFLKFRKYLEYTLGEQAALVAQQRSREILQNIRPENQPGITAQPSHQAGDQPIALGTGTFITNDGIILTAAHVVKGARAIKVVTQQGIKVATVISIDTANDVALLQCAGSFQAVPIKDSQGVRLGQSVFTIGFPDPQLQGFSPKMTRGEISSQTGVQDDPRDWQISVPIQPGNSGGPLFDEEGNFIGIVVAKLDAAITAKVTGALPEDVNYAVKSSYALILLQQYQQRLLPEVKPPASPDKMEDVVGRVQNSIVLILVY